MFNVQVPRRIESMIVAGQIPSPEVFQKLIREATALAAVSAAVDVADRMFCVALEYSDLELAQYFRGFREPMHRHHNSMLREEVVKMNGESAARTFDLLIQDFEAVLQFRDQMAEHLAINTHPNTNSLVASIGEFPLIFQFLAEKNPEKFWEKMKSLPADLLRELCTLFPVAAGSLYRGLLTEIMRAQGRAADGGLAAYVSLSPQMQAFLFAASSADASVEAEGLRRIMKAVAVA